MKEEIIVKAFLIHHRSVNPKLYISFQFWTPAQPLSWLYSTKSLCALWILLFSSPRPLTKIP